MESCTEAIKSSRTTFGVGEIVFLDVATGAGLGVVCAQTAIIEEDAAQCGPCISYGVVRWGVVELIDFRSEVVIGEILICISVTLSEVGFGKSVLIKGLWGLSERGKGENTSCGEDAEKSSHGSIIRRIENELLPPLSVAGAVHFGLVFDYLRRLRAIAAAARPRIAMVAGSGTAETLTAPWLFGPNDVTSGSPVNGRVKSTPLAVKTSVPTT